MNNTNNCKTGLHLSSGGYLRFVAGYAEFLGIALRPETRRQQWHLESTSYSNKDFC